MWICRLLITTYGGGHVRVTRYQIDRPARYEVEARVVAIMGTHVLDLEKPDSGDRVAFDVVIRETKPGRKGYLNVTLEEGILDILPEDDIETPAEVPGSIVI
jgi:hypothetical protein